MKRFLLCLFTFLFVSVACVGSGLLLSINDSSYSENVGEGIDNNENSDIIDDIEAYATPTNDSPWTSHYANSFAGGSGTQSSPYLISNGAQLARLAYLINNSSTNSTYATCFYKQTANIDLSDYYWVAIGDSSSLPFSGYYDGGGYTISNMYVTNTYSNYGGLFGYWNFTISNPTYASYIKNITLESPYIYTSSSRYVGAVVCEAISFSFSAGAAVSSLNISDITVNNGYVRNTGTFSNSDGGYTGTGGIVGYTNICTSKTIQNCSFEGTVRGTACAGGILGQMDRRGALTISNCTVSGDITATTTIAGGIVGGAELENGGTDSITISSCSNYAEIKGNNRSGGIIGTSDFTISISYCENYGTIDSDSGYAGGIASYLNDGGSVSHCENYGQVDGTSYVGGVVGDARYTNIINCYNTSSVTGKLYVGGVVGYISNGEVTNSYNTGCVTTTYSSETTGYVGGVVGNNSSSTVTNSYNIGPIISSGSYVGGVVGNNSSSSVANVYNMGTVISDYNGADGYVGGIAGRNGFNSTVSNSYNTGSVTGSARYVGGVAGYNGQSAEITNSYNAGTVSSKYSGSVGGVVGYNNLSTVSNSYNTGTVTGSSSYVGGVVGCNYNGSDVYNSFNTGSVTGTGSYVGAIVGRNYYSSPTVYNCYWGIDCTQTLAYGSNSGTVANCSRFSSDSDPKTESWYTTTSNWYSSYPWDFTDTWGITQYANDGYPYLLDVGNIAPDNTDYLWTDSAVTTRDTSFEGGGTASDPYLISSAEELAGLAYLTNISSSTTYNSSNVYYRQTADINVSAYWWDAIGRSGPNYYFRGHYDGDGHTVSGIYTQPGSSSTCNYQGLFGYVYGSSTNKAEISNVGVINSNIQGYYCVGGIAGYAFYTNITNCYNTSSVTGSSSYIGGVVGYNYSLSTVTNSYNTGSVTGSSTYVGGVAGISTQNSTIINSYNSGDVSSSYTGSYSYVGGIAGSNSYSSEIRNTYNLGNISGTDFVGGIAGENYNNSSIESSYNEGDITGSSSNGIGGIVGSNASNTIVENCYNEGDVITSVNNVGGVVGVNDTSATVRNCYNTGYIKGNDTVGGVVGNNRYSSIVTSCYNTGSIETNITAGGVVGHNNEDATVSDSYNAGFVNGIDSNVGGVVGANNNALIYNCYNRGGIFCQNGNVGGVVGDNFNSGTIYNIFNVGPVDGNGSVGGVLGSNSSGSLSYCYWGVDCTQTSAYGSNAGTVSNNSRFSSNSTPKTESWYTTTSNWNSSYPWDFKLIWAIDSSQNDGYPILSMKILYEITLDPNGGEGGTSLINLDFSKGWLDTNFDSISSIDVPTRTGYTFDGYYTQAVGGIQIVDMYGNLLKTDEVLTFTNDNTTIYAHWVANRYNNIYYYMNSQGDTTSTTQKRIYEERFITLSSSALSYYSNYGWELYGWLYNDSTGTGITFEPSESVYQTSYNTSTSTLYWYAVSSRTISISYDGNGGIYSGDSTTATQYWNQYGNVLNISSLNITSIVPKRDGYTFRGWSTDPNWSDENNSSVLYNSGDSISFLYNSNNSYTLYAIWEPNIYKVTLITQSSDETINLYLKYETGWFTNENCSDSYATTSIAVPKYAGYTFNGYYTLENGLGLQIIASNGEILQNTLSFTTEDTNLYAYWEATNPAYYDEEKGYWYVEMGMFPQDRVTNSEIISELDNLRLAGDATDHTYQIGEYTLNSYIYNEEEYAYLSSNNTYYKVLPVRYVLAGSHKEGDGTESADVTAITEKIVFASVFDNAGLSLGEGFRDSELYTNSNSLVTSTMIDTELLTTREFIVEKYMDIIKNEENVNTNTEENAETITAKYTVSNVAEIAKVFGSDYEAEFSDLVSDILGRSKMYWTRDLGSNTNVGESITRFGSVTQTDMDMMLGFRVTIALANFACV